MLLPHPSSPSQMPSLHTLSLRGKVQTAGHYGVNSDASTAIGSIALRRLMRTKDDGTVGRAATSPLGTAMLVALKGVLLRVAFASGGVDPNLSDANITSLFNLTTSIRASMATLERFNRVCRGRRSASSYQRCSKRSWPPGKTKLVTKWATG